MSLEPPTAVESSRDDLSAARYWLDIAADSLPPGVFDSGNLEHLRIAAMLGDGYAFLAHYSRTDRWRAEDLDRIGRDRAADLARIAQQREEDLTVRETEVEQVLARDQRALQQLQEVTAAVQNLPRGWRGALRALASLNGGQR